MLVIQHVDKEEVDPIHMGGGGKENEWTVASQSPWSSQKGGGRKENEWTVDTKYLRIKILSIFTAGDLRYCGTGSFSRSCSRSRHYFLLGRLCVCVLVCIV